MDRNFFLALGLILLWVTVWMSTQEDKLKAAREQQAQQAVAEEQATAAPNYGTTIQPRSGSEPAVQGDRPEDAGGPRLEPAVPERRVVVENDLYRAEFTTRGGGLVRWELKTYDDREVDPPLPVELTTHDPDWQVALATPFTPLGFGDLSAAPYEIEEESNDRLIFKHVQSGVTLRKVYSFEPDSYSFRLRLEVANGTPRSVEPIFEIRWPAQTTERSDFLEYALVALHEAEVESQPIETVGNEGFFGGLFSPDLPLVKDVDWAGAQTRYFIAAIATERPSEANADFVPVGGEKKAAYAALWHGATAVVPGYSADLQFDIYIGPKEPERIAHFGKNLNESVNRGYSWVTPLTDAFSWLLRGLYGFLPNYGVAIILLTILVRGITAPLTAKQMRSMKHMATRMKEIKPKIDALQEKFGDDRARLQQEQMRVYREENVNPAQMLGSGCLPMLLQFPVFIGLFFSLQSTIELRQAPFVGWINDLSQPEVLFDIPGIGIPIRVLPLIMGLSMVLQQRLTPQTSMDPAQARMMQTVMPIVFTFIFYQFASGLVLYWLVSNLLGIAQQMWLNRNPEPASS